MQWFLDPQIWLALVTLTALEIVLGVDNIIFLAIIVSRLPPHQQPRARFWGLAGAMGTRILLLFSLSWLATLTKPLFTIPLTIQEISGRDIVLILGGLFLLYKATDEIHDNLEGDPEGDTAARIKPVRTFAAALVQIALLDIVFSLDSVITAIGMTNHLPVMVAAIVIAVITMMIFAAPLSRFVERHPTVKILALSFLMLVGVALIGEGLDFEIPKGYIYFAMAFSVAVEMINLRIRKQAKQ